jgi:hypothetical protein
MSATPLVEAVGADILCETMVARGTRRCSHSARRRSAFAARHTT